MDNNSFYDELQASLSDTSDREVFDKQLKASLAGEEYIPPTNKQTSLQNKTQQKLSGLQLASFSKGKIIGLDDADTPIVQGWGTGGMRSYDPIGSIDSVEKDHMKDGKIQYAMDIIKNSKYKSGQLDQVAKAYGKQRGDVTNEDLNNYSNWQTKRLYQDLTTKTSIYDNNEAFDGAVAYEDYTGKAMDLDVLYKVSGVGHYGRPLTEFVNPHTKESVTYRQALNSGLTVNTQLARIRAGTSPITQQQLLDTIAGASDSDGRFGEGIDQLQSGMLQQAAKILNIATQAVGVTDDIDGYLRSKGITTLSDFLDPEKGQAVADAITGVKQSTRQSYAEGMAKASNHWDEGNYLKAIWGIATQFDRLLIDSMPSMATMMIPYAGVSILAATTTIDQSKQYALNNNGEEWTANEWIESFALNTALLIPEKLLVKAGISKFIKGKTSSLDEVLGFGKGTPVKAAALGAGEEFLQETAQGVQEELYTRNKGDDTPFSDVVKGNLFEGAAGAVVGGGVSGGIAMPRTILGATKGTVKAVDKGLKASGLKRNNNNDLVNELSKMDAQTTSKEPTESVIETPRATIDRIAKNIDLTDPFGSSMNAAELQNILDEQGAFVNEKETAEIKTLLKTLDVETISVLGSSEEATKKHFKNMNKEEATVEIQRLVSNLGKEVDATTIETVITVAKRVGVTEEVIRKTLDEVRDDAVNGPRGYKTYAKHVTQIRARLDKALVNDKSTPKEIEILQGLLNGNIKGLENYYNTQVSKLSKVKELFSAVSKETDPKKTLEVSLGNSFKVFTSKMALATHSLEEGKGITKIYRETLRNIEGIRSALVLANNATLDKEGNKYSTEGKFSIEEIGAIKKDITEEYNKAIIDVIPEATTPPVKTSKKVQKGKATKSTKKPSTQQKQASPKRLKEIRTRFDEALKDMSDNLTQKGGFYAKNFKKVRTLLNHVKMSKVVSQEYKDELEAAYNAILDKHDLVGKALKEAEESTTVSKGSTELTKEDLSIYEGIVEVLSVATIEAEKTGGLGAAREAFTELVRMTNDKTISEDLRTALNEAKKAFKAQMLAVNEQSTTKTDKSSEKSTESTTDLFVDSNQTEHAQALLNLSKGNSLEAFKKVEKYKKYLPKNLLKVVSEVKTLLGVRPMKGKATKEAVEKLSFVARILNNGKEVLWITDSPARLLLFSGTNKIQGNVAFAIDHAINYYLGYLGGGITPKTKADVARMLGTLEGNVSNDQVKFFRANGMYKKHIAGALGKEILSLLGISRATTGDTDTYNRLEADLGHIALMSMHKQEYVKLHDVENVKLNKALPEATTLDPDMEKGTSTGFVKVRLTPVALKARKREYDKVAKEVDVDNINVRGPLEEPLKKSDESFVVKNANGLVDIPKKAIKVLKALLSTKYTINTRSVQFVRDNLDQVKKDMGFTSPEDLKKKGMVRRESDEAKNEAIEKELSDLFEAVDSGMTDMYFSWSYTINGRYNMDSTTINPQTNKLQRFIISPISRAVQITKSKAKRPNIKAYKAFYYTLAQSFGMKTGDKYDKDIIAFGRAIADLDIAVLKKAYSDGTLFSLDLFKDHDIAKPDHVGQLIEALDSLENFHSTAIGEKFTVTAAPEFDAVTSGFVIKLMQFPIIDDLMGWLGGGGVFDSSEETRALNEVKASNKALNKAFLDSYQKLAKETEGKLHGETKDIDLWKVLEKTLPRVTGDIIPSTLRTLFKTPFMTFNYAAAIGSIKKAFSNEVMHTLIDQMVANDKNNENYTEINDLYDLLNDQLTSDEFANLRSALKGKDPAYIKLGKLSLERRITSLINKSYGVELETTLTKHFKPLMDINRVTNDAFAMMYEVFNQALNRKLTEAKVKGIDVTAEMKKKWVRELLPLFPVIEGPNSKDIKDGIPVSTTTQRTSGKAETKVEKDTFLDVKGNPVTQKSIQAIERIIDKAISAGSVIPIHTLDGTALGNTILLHPDVLPIHDAFISSILDMGQVSKDYNKQWYESNKNYSVFAALEKRMAEVIENVDKYNKGKSKKERIDFRVMEVYDQTAVYEMADNPATVMITIEHVTQLMKDLGVRVKQGRKKLYGRHLSISHMEGIEGSVYHTGVFGSDQEAETAEGNYEQLEETLYNSKEARVGLLEYLDNLSGVKAGKAHIALLKSLVGLVSDEFIQGVKVHLDTKADKNKGTYTIDGRNIRLGISSDSKVAYLDKPASEVYAHELMHAITQHVIENKSLYKKAPVVRQIEHIRDLASKLITVEDLMPDKSIDIEVDRKNAEKLWEYMFNSGIKGLHEFIAVGLTNEKVNKILSKATIIENKEQLSLVDKLVDLARKLLSVFQSKFLGIKQSNQMDEALLELTMRLAQMGNNAAREVRARAKPFDMMMKALDTSNVKVSKMLKKITAKLESKGIPSAPESDSKIAMALWLIRYIPRLLTDASLATTLETTLDTIGFKPEGFVQGLIRDSRDSDSLANAIEMLILQAGKVDKAAKAYSGVVRNSIVNAFRTPPTETESKALTRIGLETDLSVLLENGYSIEETLDLIKGDSKREAKIKEVESKITALDKDNSSWYISSAKLLARFMVTNVGNEALNTNAYSISKGILTNKRIDPKKGAEALIDELTTLYAVSKTTPEARAVFSSLDSKGLKNFLDIHKIYRKEAVKEVFGSKFETVKGMVKKSPKKSGVALSIKPLADKEPLEDRGYVLIEPLEYTEGRPPMGLYKSNTDLIGNYNRSGILLPEVANLGKDLTSVIGGSLSSKDRGSTIKAGMDKEEDLFLQGFKLVRTFTSNSGKKFGEFLKPKDAMIAEFMESSTKARKELIKSMREGADVSDVTGVVPVVDIYGKAVNYAIPISKAQQEEHQPLDDLGERVLSGMLSSKKRKDAALKHNQQLIKVMLDDHNLNTKEGHLTGVNNKIYVEISPHSKDPKIAEIYNILPDEVKESIGNKEDGYISVRRDMLLNYFGVRDMSILDTFIGDIIPKDLKPIVKYAEIIVKELVALSKIDIIIKTPNVFIGNIISNLMFEIQMGATPLQAIRMQLDNARNLRGYLGQKEKYDILAFDKEQGRISSAGLAQMNRIGENLKRSPIHDLMEAGMYQAIVEDISAENRETSSKIGSYLDEKTKALPSLIRTGARWAYLSESTGFFKAVTKITQYSDFVARASEYQRRLAKGQDKKSALERVLRDFINYDLPATSFEKYLNDIGIMMFTTYTKRIQRVIRQGFTDNPVNFILSLATATMIPAIDNLDDITEQSVFTKNLGNMFYSPLDHVYNVAAPSGLQLFGVIP